MLLTIALVAASATLASCARLSWDDDVETPTPITAESVGDDDAAAGEAEPVARVEPLVKLGNQAPLPVHEPTDPDSPGLSKTFTPQATTAPAAVEPVDGDHIGRRSGYLRRNDEDGWTFEFRDELEAPPLGSMTVLPGSILESMERVVAESADQPVLFGVSGEVTRYRNHSYLIIRRAVVQVPSPAGGSSR